MKLGCCLPGNFTLPDSVAAGESEHLRAMVDGLRYMKQIGYDYVECSVGMLVGLSDEDMKKAIAYHKQGLLTVEACNCFIPGIYPLAGDHVEMDKIKEYLEKALSRIAALGGDVVVFGSGGARRFPENLNYADGMKQLEEFMVVAEGIARKYGVTIVIEPLNHNETNNLLTVAESAEVARRLNLPNLKVLGDAYHMYIEGEKADILFENRDILRHIHVAEPEKRLIPVECPYLVQVGQALRKANYQGRVSIECKMTDFATEVKDALPVMKKMF